MNTVVSMLRIIGIIVLCIFCKAQHCVADEKTHSEAGQSDLPADSSAPENGTQSSEQKIENTFDTKAKAYLDSQHALENELWRYKDPSGLSGNPEEKAPDKTDELASSRDRAKKDLESFLEKLPAEKQREFRDKYLAAEKKAIQSEIAKAKERLDKITENKSNGKAGSSADFWISNLNKQIALLNAKDSYNETAAKDSRSFSDYLNGVRPDSEKKQKTFVFAVGPDVNMDPSSKAALAAVNKMADLINERKAGKTVVLSQFTEQAVVEAYKTAKENGGDVVFEVTSHGDRKDGNYKVHTANGWIDGNAFLSRLPSGDGDTAALFTCHAGSCQPNNFRGSIFGLSPAEEPGNFARIESWRTYVQTYPHLGVPSISSEYFRSFSIINKPIAGPDRWWSTTPDGAVTGMKNSPRGTSSGSGSPLLQPIGMPPTY